MQIKAVIITLSLSVFLGGCGIKERMINLKSKVFSDGSESSQYKAGETELTGMLLYLDPDKCPLVEGCGPIYSLLGRSLKSQIAITGDLSPEHNHLIVSVVGEPAPLPADLKDKSSYENISAVVAVNGYRLRSNIPYHKFLVDEATNFTTNNFSISPS